MSFEIEYWSFNNYEFVIYSDFKNKNWFYKEYNLTTEEIGQLMGGN